jgi:hypothetical protein
MPFDGGAERSIHVHARDDDQTDSGRECRNRGLGIGASQRPAVDRRFRSKSGERVSVSDQVGAVAMKMRHGRHVSRLEVAAMNHEDVVAGPNQLLNDGAPDESGAA